MDAQIYQCSTANAGPFDYLRVRPASFGLPHMWFTVSKAGCKTNGQVRLSVADLYKLRDQINDFLRACDYASPPPSPITPVPFKLGDIVTNLRPTNAIQANNSHGEKVLGVGFPFTVKAIRSGHTHGVQFFDRPGWWDHTDFLLQGNTPKYETWGALEHITRAQLKNLKPGTKLVVIDGGGSFDSTCQGMIVEFTRAVGDGVYFTSPIQNNSDPLVMYHRVALLPVPAVIPNKKDHPNQGVMLRCTDGRSGGLTHGKLYKSRGWDARASWCIQVIDDDDELHSYPPNHFIVAED